MSLSLPNQMCYNVICIIMKKLLFTLALLLPMLSFAQQQMLEGVFTNKGEVSLVQLRLNNGRVTAFANGRDDAGNLNWISISPDNPRPTSTIQDGKMAKDFNYYVNANGTRVYFNLDGSSASARVGILGDGSKVMQGIIVNSGSKNNVALRFLDGKIMNYALTKNASGEYTWVTMYPDNPHLTSQLQDGAISQAYKFKVRAGGSAFIYFNM